MGLLSRIERLEAESAIRRLVADYCHGFDKRDWDRFVGVWHDGAVWAIVDAGLEFVGVPAILAQAKNMWAAHGLLQSHHHNANAVVDVDVEAGTATGMTDVHVNVQFADRSWQRQIATYVDRYERRDGKWKVARREASGAAHWTIPASANQEEVE